MVCVRLPLNSTPIDEKYVKATLLKYVVRAVLVNAYRLSTLRVYVAS